MLLARIVCSDPACDEELEVVVDFVDQVDGLVCDRCGHGFVLQSVSALASKPAPLISLDLRRTAPRHSHRRAA